MQARESLSQEGFRKFLEFSGSQIRGAEVDDLKVLLEVLVDNGCSESIFDKFFVGYTIPQIGKEFDLLRIHSDSIVNIELKSDCPLEKIKAQLLRNRYYLSCGRRVHLFTFVSSSKILYALTDEDELLPVAVVQLVAVIDAEKPIDDADINLLFEPTEYLVSPFNSTQKFVSGRYFLTSQQEEVRWKILNELKPPKKAKFISLTGAAGTGKTLLIYDVARSLIANQRTVLIVHCGQLNEGQASLIERGWKIISIKHHKNSEFSDFELIIIDEAQRIYESQFLDIVRRVEAAQCTCIFSYDGVQTLHSQEATRKIAEKIASLNLLVHHKLSEKIRSNKEIAIFIKSFFKKNRIPDKYEYRNIDVNYFSSTNDAKSYLGTLQAAGWEVLRFTPSQYRNEYHREYFNVSSKTSHQVIGQEFDMVAVVVDKFFDYDDRGDLTYHGSAYYEVPKMLFQNMTRARRKLNVIIVGNENLLVRCLDIVKGTS